MKDIPVTIEPTAAPTTSAPTTAVPTQVPTAPTAEGVTLPPSLVTYTVIDRVNAGGSSVLDDNLRLWRSDLFLGAGGDAITPGVSLDFAQAPETSSWEKVLQTERFGDTMYKLPIERNGQYMVQLLLVESWHDSVGTRVFHVDIQGSRAFSNVDVVAEVGFQTPLVKSHVVVVDDGAVDISVSLYAAGGSAEPPALYGIQLLAVATPSPTTEAPTSSAPVSQSPTVQPSSAPTNAPSTDSPTLPVTSAPTTSAPVSEFACFSSSSVTRDTFFSGFGDCPTYVPTHDNHQWCAADTDLATGVLAIHICSECGLCVDVAPQTPAPTPPPTLAPTTESPTSLGTFAVIDRVNAGGSEVVDTHGDVWRSDAALGSGGNTVQPANFVLVDLDFTNTPEAASYTAILNSERYGDLVYVLPIAGNGLYMIQLLVVEMWHDTPAARQFHIDVQGSRAHSDVNVYQSSGFQVPVLIPTLVHVQDGASTITVALSRAVGSPEPPALYGIVLLREETAAPSFEPQPIVNTGSPTILQASAEPSEAPTTAKPTSMPTTLAPVLTTQAPTTAKPTLAPTETPTTEAPTSPPTANPTSPAPTPKPTQDPTGSPTDAPTLDPSPVPTPAPSHSPSDAPTLIPTSAPEEEEQSFEAVACKSALSCSSLEYPYSPLGDASVENVCGESPEPCRHFVPFRDAASVCESQGARLCTVAELRSDAARGSGCQFDFLMVWTATPCGENAYTVTGGSSREPSELCHSATDETALYGARCCGDAFPETISCQPTRRRRASVSESSAAKAPVNGPDLAGMATVMGGVVVGAATIVFLVSRWRRRVQKAREAGPQTESQLMKTDLVHLDDDSRVASAYV